MENTEKLNPCRCCNGKAVVFRKKTKSGDTGYYVKCQKCGQHTDMIIYLDSTTDNEAVYQAIELWNYKNDISNSSECK